MGCLGLLSFSSHQVSAQKPLRSTPQQLFLGTERAGSIQEWLLLGLMPTEPWVE